MLFLSFLLGLMACLLGLWGLARRIDRQAIQRCPAQAPRQAHAGVQWHAVRTGPAEPSQITVLMLHGLAGNLRHFQMGMQDALSQTHTVIAVDRPGSGYSSCARPLSLHEQAQTLHAWLDVQSIGRVLIVGHSLGGAVALSMAQQRPERVAGLALLAPLTAAIDKPPAVFLPLALVPSPLYRLLSYTLLPVLGRITQRLNVRTVFAPVPVTQGFAEQGGGWLSGRPQQIFATLHDMHAAAHEMPEIQARCKQLTLPVHVLYDPTDGVLDAQLHGRQLPKRLPNARVTRLENGGHMLPITQSQYCAHWVRQLLEDIESIKREG